jgi:hypothetical protein
MIDGKLFDIDNNFSALLDCQKHAILICSEFLLLQGYKLILDLVLDDDRLVYDFLHV